MPLVARGLGGLLDATLADLGVGGSWQSIHRVRPRVPLACPACDGSMHAKVSARGLRFFAHDAARGECPLTGETPAHRLLKSAIAAAVRMAGWHATLEAEGPDRRWRADVLAVSPDGRRRVAWEAQLSHQHDDDIRARTARYVDDGVEVVWVFGRHVTGDVPAVEVTAEHDSIRVLSPIARLIIEHCAPGSCLRYRDLPSRPSCPGHSRWETVTFALEVYVGLLCRGDMVWAALPTMNPSDQGRWPATATGTRYADRWWTSPAFLRRADEVQRAQHDTDETVADLRARQQEQAEQVQRRRRAEIARQEQQRQQHADNTAALRARQGQLSAVVLRRVTEQTTTKPWAMTEGDPDHAMGVSVVYHGRVLAVICPVASRITPQVAARLAELTIYVASDGEQRTIARRCRAGQRFVVVSNPAL